MNLKITKTEEKPLLARKEIGGIVIFASAKTPSNDEMKKAIASELKVDEKTVLVKHIYTGFGTNEAEFEAYVYKTLEDMKRVEPVTKKMKEDAKKAAEAAAAPAEGEKPAEAAKPTAPAEAPKEEKKEEPKPEAKPEEKKEASKEEKKQ